jgi:hypothetical protein
MSFARVQGGEEAITEKTPPHHAFPAANKLCHPIKILTGREPELNLNAMKQLKSLIAEAINAITARSYEITHIALMNPRCCSRTAALQSAPSRFCQALNRSTRECMA